MKIATCTLVAKFHGFVNGAIAQLAAIKALCPSDIDNYILVENGHYPEATYTELKKLGYTVIPISPLRPTRKVKYVASRWKFTFNKFYIWTLTGYDRVIYLDADCLPIIPNFHERMIDLGDFALSASRVNFRATGRFNAGVMCVKPSMDTYNQLLETLHTTAPGAELADQGLLNLFFQRFRLLPDVYNMRNWNNRIYPNIAIAHLRPTPWNHTKGSLGWQHYRRIWQERYDEGVRQIHAN